MLSGVILAGGKNARMNGANKAFLALDHMTFVERQIREMKKNCKEIIIVANDPVPFLRTVGRGIRIITDYFHGKGPLGGMHAGLTLASNDNVWIVGCDMPYISVDAAELLLTRKQDGIEAVIPRINNHDYPLHGIYDRNCAKQIGTLLEKKEDDFSALLDTLLWRELPQSDFEEKNINCRFVTSVKTPEDLERLISGHESMKLNYLPFGQ